MILAKVAACGVQVVLETHSDHVMNGVRLAVKESVILPDNVAFHFIDKKEGSFKTGISSPQVNQDGRLDSWPRGFFDEWENSLSRLL